MREKRKGKAERKMRIGRKMSSAGGGSHAWSSHARLDAAARHLACGCSPYVRKPKESSASKLALELVVHAWSSHAKLDSAMLHLACGCSPYVRRTTDSSTSKLVPESMALRTHGFTGKQDSPFHWQESWGTIGERICKMTLNGDMQQ